jgi:hypothetical protein
MTQRTHKPDDRLCASPPIQGLAPLGFVNQV